MGLDLAGRAAVVAAIRVGRLRRVGGLAAVVATIGRLGLAGRGGAGGRGVDHRGVDRHRGVQLVDEALDLVGRADDGVGVDRQDDLVVEVVGRARRLTRVDVAHRLAGLLLGDLLVERRLEGLVGLGQGRHLVGQAQQAGLRRVGLEHGQHPVDLLGLLGVLVLGDRAIGGHQRGQRRRRRPFLVERVVLVGVDDLVDHRDEPVAAVVGLLARLGRHVGRRAVDDARQRLHRRLILGFEPLHMERRRRRGPDQGQYFLVEIGLGTDGELCFVEILDLFSHND